MRRPFGSDRIWPCFFLTNAAVPVLARGLSDSILSRKQARLDQPQRSSRILVVVDKWKATTVSFLFLNGNDRLLSHSDDRSFAHYYYFLFFCQTPPFANVVFLEKG